MTIVICLFIIQEKQKQKQNKRNIKSRKMFKFQHTITLVLWKAYEL